MLTILSWPPFCVRFLFFPFLTLDVFSFFLPALIYSFLIQTQTQGKGKEEKRREESLVVFRFLPLLLLLDSPSSSYGSCEVLSAQLSRPSPCSIIEGRFQREGKELRAEK
jgi:hypothetical protein